MKYISCEDYASIVKAKLKRKCSGNNIHLAIIQVGNNEASNRYIKGKINDCNEVGIIPILHKYDNVSTDDLINEINELNYDDSVFGIIVQLPLPERIDVDKVSKSISRYKDVDGFTSDLLSPCTPLGIVKYLKYNHIPIDGKDCVIIGRSNIVGKPLAKMMTDENATVTLCHSHTRDICLHTCTADIIVSAVGRKNIITEDMVSNGSVVIDVGINFDENGKLCGDCDYKNLVNKCELITPVPKGVGLLTRVTLLQNVYHAYTLNKNK